ncbi:MAG: NAD-dependent epimerase/dehydratase family protein [Chloroflexota bacterium]
MIFALDKEHILEHTRSLWEELRGERLFLTGGTGFFGCWLLESFLWANERLKLGAEVTVLTRQPQTFIAKAPELAQAASLTIWQGDIRNFVFPTGTYAYIIHAAAEPQAENPLLMLDTIVEGTRHVLDFASQSGAKNFLLTSSGAVYGQQPTSLPRISEDYSGAPDMFDRNSAYGEGKRMAEHLCAQYISLNGLQPKIARCFAFVGPYLPLDQGYAIGNFIRDALQGGPIVIEGNGTPLRSYLYGADLAIWLWKILLQGKPLEPYNVGSEFEISVVDLANLVAGLAKSMLQKMGTTPEVIIRQPISAASPAPRYMPSTQKARDMLALDQWIALEPAINKTIQWYLPAE